MLQERKNPLSGKVVMVTRAKQQSRGFAKLLVKENAVPFLFPTIKTVPVELDEETMNTIQSLSEFDLVIFSSTNSVKYFFKLLEENGIEFPFGDISVAAVGPSTSAYLAKIGIETRIIPDEYISESLIDVICKSVSTESRVLVPRPKVTRKVIASELKKRGFFAKEIIIYETVADDSRVLQAKEAFENLEIDALTFTSGSTAKNFVSLLTGRLDLEKVLKDVVVVAIGPATAKKAESVGLRVDVVPEDYTVPGMIEALKNFYLENEKKS